MQDRGGVCFVVILRIGVSEAGVRRVMLGPLISCSYSAVGPWVGVEVGVVKIPLIVQVRLEVGIRFHIAEPIICLGPLSYMLAGEGVCDACCMRPKRQCPMRFNG